jgi:hypothetical protein
MKMIRWKKRCHIQWSFYNSLGLEQVDENNSPYVDVHNDSFEANTPHIKQKTTTRLGREVQKHKHLRDFEV